MHRHNLYDNMRLHVQAIPREWYTIIPREIRDVFYDSVVDVADVSQETDNDSVATTLTE